MWEYGKAQEMDSDEFQMFQYVIETMDTEYIQWVSKKAGRD